MAKKPAPLTSDLLVKKGDAAPSSIAPDGNPDQSAVSQEAAPEAAAPVAEPTAADVEARPTIPEPDYVIAPEEEDGEDRFRSRRLLAGVLAIVALATAGALGYSLFQSTETGETPDVAPLATIEPQEAGEPGDTPSVAPILQPSGPSSVGSPTPPETPALRPSDTDPAVTETPNVVPTPAPAPVREEVIAEAPVPPRTPATVTPPEPAPVAAAPETPAPAAEPEPAPAASAIAQPGQYVIQLLSVRSEEGARTAWERLQGAHAALLANETLNLETADLGERGTYYRVRFGAFDDKSAARSVCASLKERGQDCLVKRISD